MTSLTADFPVRTSTAAPLTRDDGLPPITASPSDLAHRAVIAKLVPISLAQVFAALGSNPHSRANLALAEFGVNMGGSFQVILPHALEHNLPAFAVDSFLGMAEPGPRDNNKYPKGRLSVGGPAVFTQRFGHHPVVKIVPGFVPDSLSAIPQETRFAFAHVDLDHYQPTLDTLNFLWPRLVPGAIVAVHDYFPGRDELTTPAVDLFLRTQRVERYDGLESTVVWFSKK